MSELIEEGLEQLGIPCSGSQMDKLNLYISELEMWNSRLNLVSSGDRQELEIRHILDCLAGLKMIEVLPGEKVADVGSGAGLPGLLLAVFMLDRRFTLIERSGKKAGFLRTSSALLGLADRVSVADSDLNNISGKFDIVTLRAFREFGDFFGSLKKITAESGSIAAYKARRETIAHDIKSAKLREDEYSVYPLKVPFLAEPRHLVVISF